MRSVRKKHTLQYDQDLLRRDEIVFMHQAGSTPCLAAIARAEGIWLEDVSGHRFIDLHGNNPHHIGYGHPRLIEAITRQIRTLPFTPRRFTDQPAVELAEKLCAIWPSGKGKVLFATGGSDAIEIALKIARVATGRYKTLSFYGSYHGSGFGALSVGGRPNDRPQRLGPLLTGALHAPPYYRSGKLRGGLAPDAEQWAEHSLECIRTIFHYEGGDIAAFIAEPIRNTPYVPPSWFWPEVRALCDRHGTLLIFDEIPTGLGKTGRMFASQYSAVPPDITVLGKALGGGMLPIAAVIASEVLDCAKDLSLGHYTHEKNPVTACAALTTLQIIEEEGLVENARQVGEWALARLREIGDRSPLITGVRGKGLLLAFDVCDHPHSGLTEGDIAASLARRLYAAGVSLSASSDGVLSMSAPLVISQSEMEIVLDRVETALREEASALGLV